MAGQLNPAWQRKPLSSNHLAKIGDRLLSDGPQPGQPSDVCQVIPFLLDDAQHNWVSHDLCQVLSTRGHPSIVCLLDETSGIDMDGLATRLQQQPARVDYCLLATTSPETVEHFRFDHVVLLVSASLDGILTAYQRIKYLAQHHKPEVGIVMAGPRDQHAAWRYFRKLAVGSLRYLDVPLLNLGFLPEQLTPAQGDPDHHRYNFLTRISERLLRSEFHCSQRIQTGIEE
jgi:hypothetical protein